MPWQRNVQNIGGDQELVDDPYLCEGVNNSGLKAHISHEALMHDAIGVERIDPRNEIKARRVKYITTKAGAPDAQSPDAVDLDFQNVLPPLLYDENTWKSATVTQSSSGQLQATLSAADLPGVQTTWHPLIIDFHAIERTNYLTPLTQECK